MRHSIYTKFILGYILFGLMCILFMNIWSTSKVKSEIIYDKAKDLYNHGNVLVISARFLMITIYERDFGKLPC